MRSGAVGLGVALACAGCAASGKAADAGAADDGGTTTSNCESGDGGFLPGCRIPGSAVTLGRVGTPFDTDEDGSRGVVVDGGQLSLGGTGGAGTAAPLIWVANSAEGTLSRIDTRTLVELARYATGPVTGPGTPDPSRTTVGLSG